MTHRPLPPDLYVTADGTQLYLTCARCGDPVTLIEAGDRLVGYNGEAESHGAECSRASWRTDQ